MELQLGQLALGRDGLVGYVIGLNGLGAEVGKVKLYTSDGCWIDYDESNVKALDQIEVLKALTLVRDLAEAACVGVELIDGLQLRERAWSLTTICP